jgi:hypothetical protein
MFLLAVFRETRVYTNHADFAVVGEVVCLQQLLLPLEVRYAKTVLGFHFHCSRGGLLCA